MLDNSDAFGPIVDGGFLPDQPRTLYDNGDFAKVPYILGSNSDEGTLFLLLTPPVETEEEYLAALADRYGDRADEVAAVYPVEDFAIRTTPSPAWSATRVSSAEPTTRRAAPRPAARTCISTTSPGPVLTDTIPFLRATHGAEIAFVFGSAEPPTPEDEALAISMQGYWTRFARTGDPNGDGALQWPLYDDATDQRINFDVENSILTGFRRAAVRVVVALLRRGVRIVGVRIGTALNEAASPVPPAAGSSAPAWCRARSRTRR